jgi:site-specific recombinase XerD
MASISKEKTGYRVQFYDGAGERKGLRLAKATRRQAEQIAIHVEHLNAAQISRGPIPAETARWLAEAEPKLLTKLSNAGLTSISAEAKTPATLAIFVDSYIAKREKSQAPRTILNWRQARESLVAYFGADKPLADVTVADAEDWRRWLATECQSQSRAGASNARRRDVGPSKGLAPNTYNRRCGFARQFFANAVDARLIADNPFAKMRRLGVKANKTRDHIVSREDADKIMAVLGSTKWRLIFALARYGGLRCPCEYKPLFWSDVRWAENRIRINSPKTGERFIPIFPELRPELEAALAEAGDAALDDPAGTPVIRHPRASSWNFATDLKELIELAGVTPWSKPFQNLRLTRANELAQSFPLHVVCEWIGHSRQVAQEHYLRASNADFAKAAESGATPVVRETAAADEVVRKVVRQASEKAGKIGNGRTPKIENRPIAEETAVEKYTRQESKAIENTGEKQGSGKSGAIRGAIQPDLAALINAWPTLPAVMRRRILDLAMSLSIHAA